MSFNLENIVRENIKNLVPYSSARTEYTGKASIYLDANENPFETSYNRYPDPLQKQLKEKVASIYGTTKENVFLGNGSDEAIDLVFRIFCEPGRDNVLAIAPSYGMYSVCAEINDIEVRKALLNEDYSLNPDTVLTQVDANSKLIFLCSPNNPTANLLETGNILRLLKEFNGIVVVDEAYIDFAESVGMMPYLSDYPNLIVLRTFSKAWGLAGIRLGMAFASGEIIELYNKVKYPYNLNILTQNFALKEISDTGRKEDWVKQIISQREVVAKELSQMKIVEKVFASDANFLLVKVKHPGDIYNYLKEKGIIVRDRSGVVLCEDSLRITIGTKKENEILLKELQGYSATL